MRLQKYLTENFMDTLNPIEKQEFVKKWHVIQKECKPFINNLKNANGFLYRGIQRSKGDIFKGKTRKNRMPLTTPKNLHFALDDVFMDMFGWKARSEGLFVTGNFHDAMSYGITYIIFPIGNYKILWSDKVGDLFTYIGGLFTYTALKNFDKLEKDYFFNKVETVIKNAGYIDKNLSDAIESENEIMINTDQYWAFRADRFENILEEIIFKNKSI